MSTVIGLYDTRFQLADVGPKSTITLSSAFAVTPGADNLDCDLDLGAITPDSIDTGSGNITTTGTVAGGTGTFTGTVTGGTVTPTKLTMAAVSTLTIATGAVTATKSYHKIDTEAAAASDDLDTINGGAAGELLILLAANGAHTVVAKNGTGNLLLAGSDFSMDNADDRLVLISDGTNWLELCRANNGA